MGNKKSPKRLLHLSAIRVKVKDIRVTGRVAQGVRIIHLSKKDKVNSIARVVHDEDTGEEEESLEQTPQQQSLELNNE